MSWQVVAVACVVASAVFFLARRLFGLSGSSRARRVRRKPDVSVSALRKSAARARAARDHG